MNCSILGAAILGKFLFSFFHFISLYRFLLYVSSASLEHRLPLFEECGSSFFEILRTTA